jgi:hypothetical protein
VNAPSRSPKIQTFPSPEPLNTRLTDLIQKRHGNQLVSERI